MTRKISEQRKNRICVRVLHFHPALAPVKIGVLPLSKKLNEGAEKIYAELCKYYNCEV